MFSFLFFLKYVILLAMSSAEEIWFLFQFMPSCGRVLASSQYWQEWFW
uniref:Uncharacterized protein n=1 Tax=Anguilla anguilla TaxID=7936 RepID=A0A0E9S2L9_ANGAN